MLKKWLEAGYMENRTLYSTHRGTPQGGLISACLLVNVLAGLEAAIKAVTRQPDKVNVLRLRRRLCHHWRNPGSTGK